MSLTPNNLDFRALVEASPEVSVVLAADAPTFTILAASDAYLDVMRKKRDEIVGRGLFEVFPVRPGDDAAADLATVSESIEEAIRTKRICSVGPFRYDIEFPAALGGGFDERYWSHRNVPIRQDNGEVVCVIHRVEDVTGFIMSERSKEWRVASGRAHSVVDELRESLQQSTRRQFYDMFMKAPAFICMLTGPKHIFTMANSAYYELVGHRDLIGRTVRDVFPEQEIDPFVQMLDKVYSTDEPQFFSEQEILLQSSESDELERRYATFSYLPTYDLFGEIEGVACFGFDVTELVDARKKVEQQAERAERENRHKDEFLAMLGHELRNPLAPINTAIEVIGLGDEGYDPERLDWGVDLIKRQLDQLIRLVDDLLDVARINRGRIELEPDDYGLEEIVAASLETSRPLIDQKEQTLLVDLPAEPVTIHVDGPRTTQVLANLVNNASKYTGRGGRIEVSARVDGSTLVVEVSDNGRGIAPDMLPEIFNLFIQADATIDRSKGGLGLGLTLVRRLVEMHGGRVEAFSEGVGKGSRFGVEMPVVVDSAPAEQSSSTVEAPSGQPHRVLVVDDNRDAADALSLMLAGEGNAVETVYDGKAALEAAEAFAPDVIFLDIGLPVMDGYQVARRLRENPQFSDTVLVAVTGYGQDADKQRAREAGFDHHLVKPARHHDIRAVLA